MIRRLVMIHLLVIGFTIQIVTYFLVATPWGFPPTSEAFSNPRVPFAPVLFITGILIAFGAALAYELIPDKRSG
jgi:hypothetical protein